MQWTAHPARERPRDLVLVSAVVFLTMGAVLASFGSLFLTFLAAVILLLSVGSFLFPTHYRVDDEGVEERRLLRRRARSWQDLRRFQFGRRAALVSPFAAPSWLDRHRGIILLLDGVDREELRALLEERIGSAV